MHTRENKTISIMFDAEDRILINRLIKEQVGKTTIGEIIEDMSYVINWYKDLLSIVTKIETGWYTDFSLEEICVIKTVISKAYNNDSETDKEAIKKIGDTIDYMHSVNKYNC